MSQKVVGLENKGLEKRLSLIPTVRRIDDLDEIFLYLKGLLLKHKQHWFELLKKIFTKV